MLIGLSGGGARSFAHIGFMQAVKEVGIEPTGFCGTSGGAILATLLANGWSLKEIEQWVIKTDFSKLIKWNKLQLITKLGFPEGLMNSDGLGKEMQRLQDKGWIKPVPDLWINATDVSTFDERVFDEKDFQTIGFGNIIQASTAIPGVIAAKQIGEKFYWDGGVSKNPTDPQDGKPMLVLHLGYPSVEGHPKGWLNNVTAAVSALQWHRDKFRWKAQPNIEVVKLPIKHVQTTDFDMTAQEKRDLITYGYQLAIAHFRNLD